MKLKKDYYISVESDDWVTPEETLLDSGSSYSDIEKPISGSIFRFFTVVFVTASCLLAFSVFKISIIDGAGYTKLAMQNKSANFPLPPPRGMIVDKSGIPLVKNIPVFNLLAVTRELKESDDLEDYISRIADVVKRDKLELLTEVKEDMKSNSAFFAHKELDKNQALAIEYLGLKGFYIVPDTKREYTDKQKTSHLLGYIGKVSKDDLKDDYYFPIDTIGRLGIERYYEEYLRGEHGNILFSKGEGGYIANEPKPGKTLALNIDHDLQIKLYDEVFATLRNAGISGGAGIIQNPKTGAVLAMVSFPDFDNNIFITGVSGSDYRRLFESKSKPLFNKTISGLFNPGSTIKPLVGMAALQEKIMSPSDTIHDCVSLTVPNPYNPEIAYTFDNWRAEFGPFNLKRSIANSCNIYFFTVGGGHGNIKGLGAEKLTGYYKKSLADSELGIDIPGEEKGFVPTPEWKLREKGEGWYLGDTYNISIGQGDLLVTPLWLNSYISAIANGGTIYKPKIAKAIMENNKIAQNFEPETASILPFSKDIIAEMKNDMKETVLTGTAQVMKQLPVQMAAKTGTAEVMKGRTTNSLFTVFGPYEDPEISMTILIEGTTTQQGLAIMTAYNVLKWHFSR